MVPSEATDRLADALATYRRAASQATDLGRQWAPYGVDSVIFRAIESGRAEPILQRKFARVADTQAALLR